MDVGRIPWTSGNCKMEEVYGMRGGASIKGDAEGTGTFPSAVTSKVIQYGQAGPMCRATGWVPSQAARKNRCRIQAKSPKGLIKTPFALVAFVPAATCHENRRITFPRADPERFCAQPDCRNGFRRPGRRQKTQGPGEGRGGTPDRRQPFCQHPARPAGGHSG